jgi:hypothetical protein
MSDHTWPDQILFSDVPKMSRQQIEDALQGVYEELKLDRRFGFDSTRHYRLLRVLLDRQRELQGERHEE